MKTFQKMALLTALYFSQGLPFGFFHSAIPALLRQRGVSLTAIGFMGLLALPWSLKFLFGPMVDAKKPGRLGRRRGVIIPLQLLAALNLLLVGASPESGGLPLLLAASFLSNVFAATQDIATDALAVELLSHGERGLGNGIQVAGYRLGMIVGGGVVLILMETLGWRGTFFAMAAALLVATVPVALYREPARPPPPGLPLTPALALAGSADSWAGLNRIWKELWLLLSRPGLTGWLLAIALYKFGEALVTGMIRPFMVDAGLSLADIGRITGIVGSVAGAAGALLGGLGVNLFGRRGALIVFGLVQAGSVGMFVYAVHHPTYPVIYAMTAAEHLSSGLATAALFTAMMDACRPGREGTDYTLQSCVDVWFKGVAGAVGGFSADRLGFARHFLMAGAVSLIGTVYVAILPRRSRELAFPSTSPSPSVEVAS